MIRGHCTLPRNSPPSLVNSQGYTIITKDAPLARFGGILSELYYGKSENGRLTITTCIPDDLVENKAPFFAKN